MPARLQHGRALLARPPTHTRNVRAYPTRPPTVRRRRAYPKGGRTPHVCQLPGLPQGVLRLRPDDLPPLRLGRGVATVRIVGCRRCFGGGIQASRVQWPAVGSWDAPCVGQSPHGELLERHDGTASHCPGPSRLGAAPHRSGDGRAARDGQRLPQGRRAGGAPPGALGPPAGKSGHRGVHRPEAARRSPARPRSTRSRARPQHPPVRPYAGLQPQERPVADLRVQRVSRAQNRVY